MWNLASPTVPKRGHPCPVALPDLLRPLRACRATDPASKARKQGATRRDKPSVCAHGRQYLRNTTAGNNHPAMQLFVAPASYGGLVVVESTSLHKYQQQSNHREQHSVRTLVFTPACIVQSRSSSSVRQRRRHLVVCCRDLAHSAELALIVAAKCTGCSVLLQHMRTRKQALG